MLLQCYIYICSVCFVVDIDQWQFDRLLNVRCDLGARIASELDLSVRIRWKIGKQRVDEIKKQQQQHQFAPATIVADAIKQHRDHCVPIFISDAQSECTTTFSMISFARFFFLFFFSLINDRNAPSPPIIHVTHTTYPLQGKRERKKLLTIYGIYRDIRKIYFKSRNELKNVQCVSMSAAKASIRQHRRGMMQTKIKFSSTFALLNGMPRSERERTHGNVGNAMR